MKLLYGKNNFLFLNNDTNNVIEQITGKKPLGKNELSQWAEILEYRTNFCKEWGGAYKLIIIPNKHVVYEQYLPDDIKVSQNRSALQIFNRNPEICIYPLNFFKNINQENLYYKTDTHWTPLGCVLFMNHLARNYSLSELEYHVYHKQFLGDLGNKLSPALYELASDINFHNQSKEVFDNKIVNSGRVRIFEHVDSSLPVAVIFGDSFTNAYLNIISQYFSRLYFFHAPIFDKNIVKKVSPDFVFNENVERYIHKVPENKDFSEYTNSKIFANNYHNRKQLENLTQAETISGIDYNFAIKYVNDIKRAQNFEQYDFSRFKNLAYGKYYDYPLVDYSLDGFWDASRENPFTAWAIVLPVSKKIVSLSFYLQNLSKNTSLFLSVLPLYENQRTINLSGNNGSANTQVLYHMKIDNENLDDEGEITFNLSKFQISFDVKLPEIALFMVYGTNYLGCGRSNFISAEFQYFLRGYYSLNFNKMFYPVSSRARIWHKVIYNS